MDKHPPTFKRLVKASQKKNTLYDNLHAISDMVRKTTFT